MTTRKKIRVNGFVYWMENVGNTFMFYGGKTFKYGISIEDVNWTEDEKRQLKTLTNS
jgi:hypothetical protein